MRIHWGGALQDVPHGGHYFHGVCGHGRGEGAQQGTEGHDDLLPQPGVGGALLPTAQEVDKGGYVVGKSGQQEGAWGLLCREQRATSCQWSPVDM